MLTGLAFAILLIVAVFVSTVGAINANRARAEAIVQRAIALAARDAEAQASVQAAAERDRSARSAYISTVNLARQEWLQGNPARTRASLAAARPAKQGDYDFRGFEWFYLDRLTRMALWTYAPSGFLVPSIAVGPDRTWIALARDSDEPGKGDIQILDAQTSREIGLIPAGRHVGSGIALGPDGSRVASCAEDQSVVVWDSRSGAEVIRFRGHKVNPLRVAFSPDGRLLASLGAESRAGGSKSELKVWDLADNRAGKTSIEIASYVYNAAFSPDGRFLATAGPGIQVWDAASGKLVWQTPATELMTDVAYAPDGKSLAGASFEGWIGFWTASDGTRGTTLAGHRGEVHCLAFRPDGKRLATAGRDRVIRIWDLSTNVMPTELRGHESDIWDLAYSANGDRLASASFLDGVVHIWDPDRSQENLELKTKASRPPAMPTFDVAFSASGRTVAAARGAGSLETWEVARASSLFCSDAKEPTGRNWVTYSSDPDVLATLDHDRSIVLRSATTGAVLRKLEKSENTGQCGRFSPDGRYLAAVNGREPTVGIWDSATGMLAKTLKGHAGNVVSLAFSPDSRTLASGGLDTTVRLWDVASGQERLVYRRHSGGVFAVAFRPDGTGLASADAVNLVSRPMIHLWDASTGKTLARLQGHSTFARRLSFLPDGRRLVSLGDDGFLKLWDLVSGQETLTIAAHRRNGSGLAVSPDGYRIATSGAEGDVLVWDATPQPAGP